MSFLSDLFGNSEVNANKWFSVVESGRFTKVQEYINKSDNIIYSRDVRDQDALMIAASKGYKDIVEILLQTGADTNNQSYDGSTALMDAASHGHKDIVEILLKAGADVNKSRHGSTAMTYAAMNGQKDVIEILLKAGADVNAYNNISGSTPLNGALLAKHKDCVELLVKAGADINLKDNNGKSALMYAKEKGYKDIEEVLLKTGVDPKWRFEKGLISNAASASAGDGVSRRWRCPHCGMVWEKDEFLLLLPPHNIQGTNTCACGVSYNQKAVYSGQFDYPPNKKIHGEKAEIKQMTDSPGPTKTLEQLRAENPITDEDWIFKAIPLISDNKYSEAIECYNKALEINPKSDEAWHDKAEVFSYQGNKKEAIACLDKAIEINPKNYSHWVYKGIFLKDLEKYPEALACFDKAIEIDPENNWAKDHRIISLRMSGMKPAAEPALSVEPQLVFDREPHAMSDDSWMKQGIAHYTQKDYSKALEFFDKALTGFYDAMNDFENTVSIDPAYAVPLTYKGDTLVKQEKYPEALECFNMAISINPRSAYTWNEKGVTNHKIGKFAEAIACYNKAIDIDQSNNIAKRNRDLALKHS